LNGNGASALHSAPQGVLTDAAFNVVFVVELQIEKITVESELENVFRLIKISFTLFKKFL